MRDVNQTFAIDPGASGGFAWHDAEGAKAIAMPKTEGDIRDQILRLAAEGYRTCYIERVGGFIGTPQPGGAMFKFGRGYGFLLGVMAAYSVRVELVQAHTWQQTMGIGTKGKLTTGQWKNRLKAKAQQLYPGIQVTLATADALLILEYATGRINNFS